jgi:hypothetical protein
MNARTPFLLTICLGLCACGGDARGSSGDKINADAQPSPTSQDVQQSRNDATVPPEPRGVAGAHVWFATSDWIAIRAEWSFIGRGGGSGSSGSSCLRFDRTSLSTPQLDALAALTLVPITDGCTLDGYHFQELRVFDADGTSAAYRDTGCSYLRVAGANAMLPYDALDAETFASGGTTCDDTTASN